MEDLEQFSIYNLSRTLLNTHNGVSPLVKLEGSSNTGWRVARNLLKPLNHLEYLQRKEDIAKQLNLHNIITPPPIFDSNYRLLESHQRRKISTDFVIDELRTQLESSSHAITHEEISKLLREYATVRHMEFHPCDICNLSCKGCTYGHDVPGLKPSPQSYPFTEIERIHSLNPQSIVIIGGGEPVLYRCEVFDFQQLVEKISDLSSDVTLALVTNGTYRPVGDWPNKLAWIRVSLDAATPTTYAKFRGRPLFHKVINNFLSYLDYEVPHVGISFLFSMHNIAEYTKVAAFIYQLVQTERPSQLHKVNIQYRPLRKDPYHSREPFLEAITREDIQSTVRDVLDLADSSPDIAAFLRDQTNVTAILGGNTHPLYPFPRCYYSQTFKIIRANGDIRPCFVRVFEDDFCLGNLLTDPLETIALNTLYVGARHKEHCDSHGCRQCHVNFIFDQGLAGVLAKSESPGVRDDPMY